ncbi:MAG: hypothetical protein KBD64_05895 [Gammaproteobacteria bacterium]|nr:hypothetical protein [Gammaproteobacteria bacterium]
MQDYNTKNIKNTTIIKTIYKLTYNLFLGLLLIFCVNNQIYANFNYKDYKEKPDILIISGPNYKKIVDSLINYLPEQKYNLNINYLKKEESIAKIDHSIDFIITIGRESTLRTNEYLSNVATAAPQLAVLIPHRMYNSISSELKNNKDKLRKVTAIYREQPVDRQLKLIETLLPTAKTIGILTSMYDQNSINELKQEIVKTKLNLVITENKKRENLIDSLKHVLSHSDVLLALPDPEIYNPFTSKGILVTSFRRGIPIIGYSKNYVDAGAVGAVYSKSAQIAEQAATITNSYFSKNILPPPSYPSQYSIAKNEEILNKLTLQKKRRNNILNHIPTTDIL